MINRCTTLATCHNDYHLLHDSTNPIILYNVKAIYLRRILKYIEFDMASSLCTALNKLDTHGMVEFIHTNRDVSSTCKVYWQLLACADVESDLGTDATSIEFISELIKACSYLDYGELMDMLLWSLANVIRDHTC